MDIKGVATKRNIVFLIGLIVTLVFFYKINDIILLFFIGFVLASALDPVVSWFSRRMPRNIAVLITFGLGLIILLAIIIPLLNVLIEQAVIFIRNFPIYWEQTDKYMKQFSVFTKDFQFIPSLSVILPKVSAYANTFISRSVGITVNIASSIGIIITVSLIVFIMLADKLHLKNSFLDFFPSAMRDKAAGIVSNISGKVGGYVTGQLIAMMAVGILTTIGLAIAGVNYALLLGLITGILDIIPVLGPAIALILAILVALTEKPFLAVWVLVVFGIVQWLGNAVIRPVIFSKVLELHPLLIIFSLIVAGKLLGVVGVIIAPAIAATIQVLIQELYIKQID